MVPEEGCRPEELTAEELDRLVQELGTDLAPEQLLAITQFILEAGDVDNALAILESIGKAA